jgi:UDP-GlcNAc:undecaprenyl-phosphate GlcNAc-1-phosphate transferase
LFLKFARTLGSKNDTNSNEVRWSTAKPAFGGISFYIIFLLSFATYAIIFAHKGEIDTSFFGVLIAASIGFLVGLADDAYNTKPILKFLGQFSCAVVLILSGNYITLFDNDLLNYGISFLWIVGMMNSINMLDNMDGITTSVSIGTLSTALFVLILTNQLNALYFWVILGTIGSLVGFLYYNWNPSKIYMGDTGSQFLGVVLAVVGIHFFWNGYEFNDADNSWAKFLTPLLVFLPSLVDTTTVTINRLSKGTSPFVGGRDHTTHHLSFLGLKDRLVAIFFLSLTFICGALALFLNYKIKEWDNMIIASTIGFMLLVFGCLFGITKRKLQNESK